MVTVELPTVGAVINALGGTKSVAELTQNTDPAVSNWRKAGQFPANTYLIIRGELEKLNKSAPDSLWAMKMVAAS